LVTIKRPVTIPAKAYLSSIPVINRKAPMDTVNKLSHSACIFFCFISKLIIPARLKIPNINRDKAGYLSG